MHALSIRILELLAIGLGKDRDFFREWFITDSLSTQRAIHNRPRHANVVDSSGLSAEHVKLTTPEHCDSGFITFLTTFGFPGLQVVHQGEWKSVKPVYNQLIVNLGDCFERITNFELKATRHRVLDINVERYSSPFFLEPKYDATIPSNLLDEQKAASEPPIVYGKWLVKKILSYVEWQNLVLPDMSSRRRNAKGEIVMGKTSRSSSVSTKKSQSKAPARRSPKKISKTKKVGKTITKAKKMVKK